MRATVLKLALVTLLVELTPRGQKALQFHPHPTPAKSTVVIRENGRVLRIYSEPSQTKFTTTR